MQFLLTGTETPLYVHPPFPTTAPTYLSDVPECTVMLIRTYVSGVWSGDPYQFGMMILLEAFSDGAPELCNCLWRGLTCNGAKSDEQLRDSLLLALNTETGTINRWQDMRLEDVVFLACECRLFQLARVVLGLVPNFEDHEKVVHLLAPAVYALMHVVMHDEPEACHKQKSDAKKIMFPTDPPEPLPITDDIRECQSLVTAMLGVLRTRVTRLPNPKCSSTPDPPEETELLGFLVKTSCFLPFLFTSEHSTWLLRQFECVQIANVLTSFSTASMPQDVSIEQVFEPLFKHLLSEDHECLHATAVWKAIASIDTPVHTFTSMDSESQLVLGEFEEAVYFREMQRKSASCTMDSRSPTFQMSLLQLLLKCHVAHSAAQLPTVLTSALNAAMEMDPAVPQMYRAHRFSGAVVAWLWSTLLNHATVVQIAECVLPSLGTESRFITQFASFKSRSALETLLEWLATHESEVLALRAPGSGLEAWNAQDDLKAAFLALSEQGRSGDFTSLLTFATRPSWVKELPLDNYNHSQNHNSTTLLWVWCRMASGIVWCRVCTLLKTLDETGALQLLHAGLANQTSVVLKLTSWTDLQLQKALHTAAVCGCVPIIEEILLAHHGSVALWTADPLVLAVNEALWTPGGRGTKATAEHFATVAQTQTTPPSKKLKRTEA